MPSQGSIECVVREMRVAVWNLCKDLIKGLKRFYMRFQQSVCVWSVMARLLVGMVTFMCCHGDVICCHGKVVCAVRVNVQHCVVFFKVFIYQPQVQNIHVGCCHVERNNNMSVNLIRPINFSLFLYLP